MRFLAVAPLLVSMSVVACSGGDFGIPAVADDSASAEDIAADVASEASSDAPIADSDVTDSTITDTGVVDSTVTDTGAIDTMIVDTGKPDTKVFDANLQDTKTQDTSVQDSAVSDTGGGTPDARPDQGSDTRDAATTPDGATGCPRPPSAATIDTTGFSCEDLEAKYVGLIEAAQVCECDGECGTFIANNFCDSCSVVVNPATDAYAKMLVLRKVWDDRSSKGLCPPKICPLVVCPVPKSGACTPQLIGSTCRDLSTTN